MGKVGLYILSSVFLVLLATDNSGRMQMAHEMVALGKQITDRSEVRECVLIGTSPIASAAAESSSPREST